MSDDIKWLIELQGELAKCRQLAARTPNQEAKRLLVLLTDEVEALARKIDAGPPRGSVH